MKKTFLFAAAFFFALCSPLLISCGDDDEPNSGGEEKPINEELLDPDASKKYLEEVGIEFLNKFKADDFRRYVDLFMEIYGIVGESDLETMEPWLEEFLEKTVSEEGNTSERTDVWSGDTWTYIYHYLYQDTKYLILASNLTGHWTLEDDEWTRTDADDLSATVTNAEGKKYALSLTTKGKVETVHFIDDEEGTDHMGMGIYDDETHTVTYEKQCDKFCYYVGVPEHLTLALTENGAKVAEWNIDVNLKDIKDSEFDLAKSSVSAKTTLTLDNGYSIKFEDFTYNNKKFASKAAILKKGEKLTEVAVTSDIRNMAHVTLPEFINMYDETEDAFESAETTAGAGLSIDVLGKVQLKGSVDDIAALMADTEAADDDDKDETKFKSDLEKINKHLDINLYYQGGNKKQATFLLQPIEYDLGRWMPEPAITFPDGSSYSMEVYFNEEDFKSLIKVAKQLRDDFYGLMGGEEEYVEEDI